MIENREKKYILKVFGILFIKYSKDLFNTIVMTALEYLKIF